MKSKASILLLIGTWLMACGFPQRSCAELTPEQYSLYLRIVSDPKWMELPGTFGNYVKVPPTYPSISEVLGNSVKNKAYSILEAGLCNAEYNLRVMILRRHLVYMAIEDRKAILLRALVNPAIWLTDERAIAIMKSPSSLDLKYGYFQDDFVGLLGLTFQKKLNYPKFWLAAQRTALADSLRASPTVPTAVQGSATPHNNPASSGTAGANHRDSGKPPTVAADAPAPAGGRFAIYAAAATILAGMAAWLAFRYKRKK